MPTGLVAIFVDYENIRRGIWRYFQKRVPEDIPVPKLLAAIKQVSDEVGTLDEAFVFGDWTIRGEDAREIERTPHFRAQLVLRSDSKKDRTDPVMNFAIYDFFQEHDNVGSLLLCAGDSDYCEVVKRGTRLHRSIFICGVGAQTAPELLSLAKAFYPIELRLGLKAIDVEEVKKAIAAVDPAELRKWAPFIRQLDLAEHRMPYVVANYFLNKYLTAGIGYGDSFEQKSMTLSFAKDLKLLEFGTEPHPQTGQPVRTIRLVRDSDMVKAVLAGAGS